MEIQAYEITINKDVSGAKEVVENLMKQMGFTVSYTNALEAIAKRGGAAASIATTFFGSLAGKDNVPLKLKFSFHDEGNNRTMVVMSDDKSGLSKGTTLTGGTTKRALEDVYSNLKEGIRRSEV